MIETGRAPLSWGEGAIQRSIKLRAGGIVTSNGIFEAVTVCSDTHGQGSWAMFRYSWPAHGLTNCS